MRFIFFMAILSTNLLQSLKASESRTMEKAPQGHLEQIQIIKDLSLDDTIEFAFDASNHLLQQASEELLCDLPRFYQSTHKAIALAIQASIGIQLWKKTTDQLSLQIPFRARGRVSVSEQIKELFDSELISAIGKELKQQISHAFMAKLWMHIKIKVIDPLYAELSDAVDAKILDHITFELSENPKETEYKEFLSSLSPIIEKLYRTYHILLLKKLLATDLQTKELNQHGEKPTIYESIAEHFEAEIADYGKINLSALTDILKRSEENQFQEKPAVNLFAPYH